MSGTARPRRMRRGLCSVCGQERAVTPGREVVYDHPPPGSKGACPGAQRPPVPGSVRNWTDQDGNDVSMQAWPKIQVADPHGTRPRRSS